MVKIRVDVHLMSSTAAERFHSMGMDILILRGLCNEAKTDDSDHR